MTNKYDNLLIIEDNPSDAELMLLTLKKHKLGNEALVIKDGEEAHNYLFCKGQYADRDRKNLPAVIFLDLKLPKIDGLEILRQIKTDKNTKKIPVIIVTSSNEYPDIKTAYELGANSYIVKPVEFNEFVEQIGKVGLYWLVINKKIS